MWGKKHRLQDPEAPPGKRLRDNLVDLYASGDIPGDRAQSLLQDAGDFARSLGSDEMQELRGGEAPGAARNRDRDLRRKLLKRSRWPGVYIQEIRCWSVKQKALLPQKVAFLLPHEIVLVLSEVSSAEVMQQNVALDVMNLAKHTEIEQQLQGPFISLSLWGDGVPFSWDRKKSVELWTLSFPGLMEKKFRDLRITITALPHHSVVRQTQDDVMRVLAWSLECLARGSFPEERLDGLPWTPEDTWRKKKAGCPVPKAAIIEVKGDWKQLYQCFGVPYWQRSPEKPLCWRCTATKDSLSTDIGPASTWLQPEHRLGHFQCLERLLEDGGELSPVFAIPFVTTNSLRIDWLHCADQGVSPVFLGGLFHLVLQDRGCGRNAELRCQQLWAEIQAFYAREATPDRLHNLTVSMIKPKKGSIELSGSGAQIRCLIPFAKELVDEWPQPLDAERFAAQSAMRHLARCYSFLSGDMQPQPDTLLDNALAFQSSLVGLHAFNQKRWQLRPKLHMFLELCAEGGPPSSSWNYREESFGGSVAHQAHRRGGLASPLAMSRGVLTKFCAKEALPRLL